MSDQKQEEKLSRRQAAIIGAFTGVLCGPFEDMQEYVDSLPGFDGITTIAFGIESVAEKIAASARADFMALCATREQPK